MDDSFQKIVFWADAKIDYWLDTKLISGDTEEQNYRIQLDGDVYAVSYILEVSRTLKRKQDYNQLLTLLINLGSACLEQRSVVPCAVLNEIAEVYLCTNELFRAFYLAFRAADVLNKSGRDYRYWMDWAGKVYNPCNDVIRGDLGLDVDYLRGYIATFWDNENWEQYQLFKTEAEVSNQCRLVVDAYRLLQR